MRFMEFGKSIKVKKREKKEVGIFTFLCDKNHSAISGRSGRSI